MKMVIEDRKLVVEYGEDKSIKTKASAYLRLMEQQREILAKNEDVLRSLILTTQENGRIEVSIPICKLTEDDDEEGC